MRDFAESVNQQTKSVFQPADGVQTELMASFSLGYSDRTKQAAWKADRTLQWEKKMPMSTLNL